MEIANWLVVLACGALTFATRLSFFAWLPHSALPQWFLRALRYVPAAVLSAILLPELLIRDGAITPGLHNERLIAGAIAILVAWRTRQALPTISSGLIAMWLLQAITT